MPDFCDENGTKHHEVCPQYAALRRRIEELDEAEATALLEADELTVEVERLRSCIKEAVAALPEMNDADCACWATRAALATALTDNETPLTPDKREPCGTCDLQVLAHEVRDLRIWKETNPLRLLVVSRDELERYRERYGRPDV